MYLAFKEIKKEKLVLFDPDHKNIYLERFKHSLELLDEEG